MKAFKQFFTKKEPSLFLKENAEIIEQTFLFLNDYSDVPQNILALKKCGDKWYDLATSWHYITIWNILTFYRCMEKLEKAKDYFDHPPKDMSEKFIVAFEQSKNKYYAEISKLLSQYDEHYQFSKMMWEHFKEAYNQSCDRKTSAHCFRE